MSNYLRFLSGLFCIFLSVHARSPYRLPDEHDPLIKVKFHDEPNREYQFRESHLEEGIFHLYDHLYFDSHLLPADPIRYRYDPDQQVGGALLSTLIQEAVDEIVSLPPYEIPQLRHFYILKMRDINWTTHAGLYVLKFKNFPFVVKLFIEVPKNFFKPGDKGFEPLCFYYMGGGVNRHLTGFTRIRNLEEVKFLIQKSPYWRERLSFPHKWFWLPDRPRWITLEGFNLGTASKKLHTKIPAIYAIVCDEIIWERSFDIKNAADREESLRLSNFLGQKIDLHINNFGIEKATGKLVVIDFEHFPTVVGIKQDLAYQSYVDWYSYLAKKMLQNTLGRNKYQRRCIQHATYTPFRFNIPIKG